MLFLNKNKKYNYNNNNKINIQTINFLNNVIKGKYYFDDDNKLFVDGDVIINNYEFKMLPIIFYEVNGIFKLNECPNLRSLYGSPYKCTYFYCYDLPKINNLEFSPQENVWDFKVINCGIKSLYGCPKKIGNNFNVSNSNKLKDINDLPDKVNTFICNNCKKIEINDKTFLNKNIKYIYCFNNDKMIQYFEKNKNINESKNESKDEIKYLNIKIIYN